MKEVLKNYWKVDLAEYRILWKIIGFILGCILAVLMWIIIVPYRWIIFKQNDKN